jgi:hypothetical protein
MADLREHGRQFNDGRDELYKTTVKYDSDLGRASTVSQFHGTSRVTARVS